MTIRGKNYVKLIVKIGAIALLLFTLLLIVSLQATDQRVKDHKLVKYVFTKMVEQHRDTVFQYASEYNIEQYTDVLLAIMLQESGGRGDDPMQASESLCGEIGCIKDPHQSIEQGVKYFAAALEKADGDLALAVQSYNFGLGFIDYVRETTGELNEEVIIEFSQMMYERAEDPSLYSCLRKEAKQYNACYGDILYAEEVLSYKQNFATTE